MKIRIFTIGKVKEKDFLDYEGEIKKRISPFSQIFEIYIEKPEDIYQKTTKDEKLIVLDITGKELTSQQFSKLLDFSKISFLIGPHNGFSREFLTTIEAGSEIISLSKLTFPHRLCKIILLEQIYRGFCIKNNLPYAK